MNDSIGKRTPLLKISENIERDSIYNLIKKISGEDIFKCYQCGNCSSGCPALEFMDITPTMIMKLSQAGDWDAILDSRTIWICATCLQCSTRCPKGIDVAAVIEAFREIKMRKREISIKVEESDIERRNILPPIAVVSAFRKFAGL